MEEPIKKTENSNSVANALIWKLLERFGVQGMQFILQIILARLLSPEHYGVLSIMIIFTSLANVFIQAGFNTALIQDKDVTEEDYSSVLWVTLAISGVLYALIFLFAPLIGSFYKMPELVQPLRILAIMLFPGALNSVQLAKVSREMDFKKVFYSNLGAILFAGIAGIVVALCDGGLWALVVQTTLNVFIATVVMQFTTRLKIKLLINRERIKVLFKFGWKLLVSGLIDTLYLDIQSLVIGKKYDSATLGFYNRGKQFPQLIITSLNSAVQSVMLPAMAKFQDQRDALKAFMRQSITLSSYVIFPLMAGLAGVAEPLVRVLLTDKWLPCVPYLQIFCFSSAFNPIHSCNLQAINAMGKSDIFLKLEIIKKSYGLLAVIIAVVFFESPIAIALTGVITTGISCFVNASPNKKLIGYSYLEQMKDMLPSLVLSAIMFVCVLFVGKIGLPPAILLVLQVITGGSLYVGFSALFQLSPFVQLLNILKNAKQL